MTDRLEDQLKAIIIDVLNLEDLTAQDITEDAPLFGGGLDLDSIDGLELVLQLEKRYGIKIASSEQSKEALGSVKVLAEYIRNHATKSI